MRRASFSVLTLSLALPAAMVFSPSAANAQSCSADAECPTGFACEVIGSSGCAASACAAGSDCPEPEPCPTEETRGCVPGPCESDAQCGADLVCLTWSYSTCTDVACPQGQECPAVEPSCEETSESRCAPQWMRECSADADCGAGFNCIEAEQCECSGSAGSDGSEPADTERLEAPDCSCTPTGHKFCEPQRIVCLSVDACPSGWSCQADPNTSVCSAPEGSGDLCATPEAENVCLPPYWDGFGYGYGVDAYATGEAARVDNDSAGNAQDDNKLASAEDDGGCHISAAGAGGHAGAFGLILAALAGFVRRRRAV